MSKIWINLWNGTRWPQKSQDDPSYEGISIGPFDALVMKNNLGLACVRINNQDVQLPQINGFVWFKDTYYGAMSVTEKPELQVIDMCQAAQESHIKEAALNLHKAAYHAASCKCVYTDNKNFCLNCKKEVCSGLPDIPCKHTGKLPNDTGHTTLCSCFLSSYWSLCSACKTAGCNTKHAKSNFCCVTGELKHVVELKLANPKVFPQDDDVEDYDDDDDDNNDEDNDDLEGHDNPGFNCYCTTDIATKFCTKCLEKGCDHDDADDPCRLTGVKQMSNPF